MGRSYCGLVLCYRIWPRKVETNRMRIMESRQTFIVSTIEISLISNIILHDKKKKKKKKKVKISFEMKCQFIQQRHVYLPTPQDVTWGQFFKQT